MLSRGLKIPAIGLPAGVLGAVASTRLVSGMLFQVQPHDAVTYARVVGALGVLSLLATYLPARRATRIDPSSRFVRSEANPAPLFGHRARNQAACWRASIRLNHSPMSFQLANAWLADALRSPPRDGSTVSLPASFAFGDTLMQRGVRDVLILDDLAGRVKGPEVALIGPGRGFVARRACRLPPGSRSAPGVRYTSTVTRISLTLVDS